MKRAAKILLSLLLPLGLVAGCAGSDEEKPLSWEEFQSKAYLEPDTGIWVANGDESFETLELLHGAYLDYLHSFDEIEVAQQRLIVNTVKGADDAWPSAIASNLTYCISQKSFGTRYNTVVSAMASAAADWGAAANVTFVHDSSKDANCNKSTAVVFNVSQVCRGQYLASAFFPSYKRQSRELRIDCTSFGNISPWTLTGVLRHELGHALGFRHEHTRPEAATCFENNSWRALTAYDSSSVMHYPQCNGTQTGDLVLTNLDKAGAASLYP